MRPERTNTRTMRTSLESALLSLLGGVGELIQFWYLRSALMLSRVGNRIAAAFVKRMAAPQAFDAEPDTLHRPVEFDCLTHIVRACRIKAARGRQQGRNQAFVPVKQSSAPPA